MALDLGFLAFLGLGTVLVSLAAASAAYSIRSSISSGRLSPEYVERGLVFQRAILRNRRLLLLTGFAGLVLGLLLALQAPIAGILLAFVAWLLLALVLYAHVIVWAFNSARRPSIPAARTRMAIGFGPFVMGMPHGPARQQVLTIVAAGGLVVAVTGAVAIRGFDLASPLWWLVPVFGLLQSIIAFRSRRA